MQSYLDSGAKNDLFTPHRSIKTGCCLKKILIELKSLFVQRGLFFRKFQKFNERKFCLCVCYGGPVSFSQTHKFFAYSDVNRFHHVQQVDNKRAKRQIRILCIPSKLLSETHFWFIRCKKI
jgi:hypothetical protein